VTLCFKQFLKFDCSQFLLRRVHFSIYAPTYYTFWRMVLFEKLNLTQLHSLVEYTNLLSFSWTLSIGIYSEPGVHSALVSNRPEK